MRVSGAAQEILCQGPEFREDHREMGWGRLVQCTGLDKLIDHHVCYKVIII